MLKKWWRDYNGVEKDIAKYEQILQVIAEIFVAYHGVKAAEELNGKKYIVHEPKIGKNPEFRSAINDTYYCAEVKAPQWLNTKETVISQVFQLPARWTIKIPDFINGEHVVLPRDNPVKD
jgi:hypothetical protein